VVKPRLAAHKEGAKANGATVIFIDETGFSRRPSLRRTWAPEGQTPVLQEHFNWQKLSAIGAVAWRPGEAATRLFLSPQPGSIRTPEKDVANYPADSIAEPDEHIRRSVRRVRRRPDIGLNLIKHAGLISKREYLQLCKGQ
jgi:hypothetical protein